MPSTKEIFKVHASGWELSHLFSPGVKTGSALVTKLGNMISYWLLSWTSTKINCMSSESPDGNVNRIRNTSDLLVGAYKKNWGFKEYSMRREKKE